MGAVEVMAVAVEVDVAAAVLGTVVMVEGVVREVGGGASRSSTQSNCIPSSLNTRMTGSPRTNRMLSAGMENGKHSRAVATVAVDLADSTAWGAMAADYEARGKVEAMAAAAGATVVTVATADAGVVTAAEVAAGSKEEGEQGEAIAEAREAWVGRLETSEGERNPQAGPERRFPARAQAPSQPSSPTPRRCAVCRHSAKAPSTSAPTPSLRTQTRERRTARPASPPPKAARRAAASPPIPQWSGTDRRRSVRLHSRRPSPRTRASPRSRTRCRRPTRAAAACTPPRPEPAH